MCLYCQSTENCYAKGRKMTCFDCKKMHSKCGAKCCGNVPIPKEIYYANESKIIRKPHDTIDLKDCILPISDDGNCVYLNRDLSCNIYSDRPNICRKFGDESHPMLCCPVLDKNGKERCRQSKRKIERQTTKYFANFMKEEK